MGGELISGVGTVIIDPRVHIFDFGGMRDTILFCSGMRVTAFMSGMRDKG